MKIDQIQLWDIEIIAIYLKLLVKYKQCLDAVQTDEEGHHTESEEDNDGVVTTDEIMRVANAITEEELEIVDDGKLWCMWCNY